MSMQVYAAPSAPEESAVPVVRRFIALRCTPAPQVCFGAGAVADEGTAVENPSAGGAPGTSPTPGSSPAAAKKKRKELGGEEEKEKKQKKQKKQKGRES